MKKNLFVAAILGMMLVLGVMVVGCADGTPKAEEGGVIYGCPYSRKSACTYANGILTGTGTHYLLSISYNEAKAKLEVVFGNAGGFEDLSYNPIVRSNSVLFQSLENSQSTYVLLEDMDVVLYDMDTFVTPSIVLSEKITTESSKHTAWGILDGGMPHNIDAGVCWRYEEICPFRARDCVATLLQRGGIKWQTETKKKLRKLFVLL